MEKPAGTLTFMIGFLPVLLLVLRCLYAGRVRGLFEELFSSKTRPESF